VRLQGGFFGGCAIECCQSHFPPTDPRCHGNEIWDKIGYNSVSVRDICEICASAGGFWRMCHRMLPIAFSADRPPLPWQRNLGQNCLYLALCNRYLRDFCVYREVFEVGPSNAANCVISDRPLLLWQRNLGQNWLYLGLCKRYLRDLCVYRKVFEDVPSNVVYRIFPDRPPLPWQRNSGQNWL